MNAPYYTGGRQIGRTQKMLEAVLEQVGKVETIAVVLVRLDAGRGGNTMTPISTQHLKDTIGKAFVDIMYLLQNGSTTDDRLRVARYYAEILDEISKLQTDGQEALCKLQTMLGEVK